MLADTETKGAWTSDLVAPDRALQVGKWRRMSRLCDDGGRFAMIAIDQRGSLRRMLARSERAGDVAAEEDRALRVIKHVVTEAIAPLATAVLTDPLYGYPGTLRVLPKDVGLLLSVEVTGYEAGNEVERRSRLIEGFSVEAAGHAGTDAVKLLLWHHPATSAATLIHQQQIVRLVGDACARTGLPFVLEVVTYSLDDGRKGAAFARQKPGLVIDAARMYSAPEYGVDLLKLEFPADLKYTAEYQDHPFAAGTVCYDRAEVEGFCRELDEAAGVPWVILSAGVDPDEFVENIQLANTAGASGFLCGRAVWKKVVDHWPDVQAMRQYMAEEGRTFFRRIREANAGARPWHAHRRFRHAASALQTEPPFLSDPSREV